jgi:cytochrome b561
MANEAGPDQSYPSLAIAIHWFTALCVFGLIPVGLLMANLDEGPTQDRLFSMHESIGLLVFALTVVRLAWKAAGGLPKPAEVLTPFERVASQTAHGLLYLLLLITPVIGWLGVGAFGGDVDVFGLFTLPSILAKDEVLSDQIFNVHLACGILIVLVVIAHVVGAIVHGMRGDGVVQRMSPSRK